ncbi:YdgA family protein [Legionella nagasakiensis]|uniref:YdgA family protein n=1 Tax=Legionella nagasakiensis TaxID=535290 RepID=UPI001055FEE6|nr:YdgA family protein [Legionella nagasakiensis]
MKKLIGLVVIILVLVLGSYYGTGLITERTLKKNVNMINQSNGLYVDVEQYDRGWFTSQAKFKWHLHVPERITKDQNDQSKVIPAQDYAMDMPLTIYHGPVIFSNVGIRFGLGYAHTVLTLPQPYAEQFSTVFSNQSTRPTLNLSVLVNYLNKSRLRIELPAFTLIAKEGKGQFEWLGMTSDVTVSSSLSTIDGDLTIDGIKIIKDSMNAVIGKITSNYDLHQTKEGLYLGEANFSFPSLMINNKDQKIFELEQFDIHTSSDVDGGLFNSYLKTSLEQIVTNGKKYGPGILKVSLKNLDAEVLAQINEQVNRMQQGSAQERQKALLVLLPELPKLFNKGAKFEISEMSFAMPEGTVAGHVLVSLPKSDSSNPFQLIQQVEGEGKFKIPAIVLKGLIVASLKQQLMQQPALPQAIAEQMKKDGQSENNVTGSADEEMAKHSDASDEQNQEAQNESSQDTSATASAIRSPADVEKQATMQTEERLSSLVQAGILKTEGNDYTIELKLENGQLSVNGQPFNPAMMKF